MTLLQEFRVSHFDLKDDPFFSVAFNPLIRSGCRVESSEDVKTCHTIFRVYGDSPSGLLDTIQQHIEERK